MKRSVSQISLLILVLLLADIYAFQGIRYIAVVLNNEILKTFLYVSYWLFSVVLYIGIAITVKYFQTKSRSKKFISFAYSLFGLLILDLIPKLFFVFFQAINDASSLLFKLLPKNNFSNVHFTLFTKIGIVVWAFLFFAILYGIIFGKYNFTVRKKILSFDHLPAAFDGLRIVQISDIHIGSFNNHYINLEKAINLINKQNADYVFFTGDLVNNYASETDGWKPTLEKINAKKGKFSILGNHDYGDYGGWDSEEEKNKNLDRLKEFHHEIGFRLLLNENVTLENKGEQISLIGVENWGKPPFKQYGNLKKALEGVPKNNFQLLLSHDPSHWDLEVLKKTNIDLTLSGHTHGMQFGFKIGNLQWSPVKMRYPRWGGLYQERKQFLYVNRGLGFIGFPGRVGMSPEITVIELKRK
ncbi:MAG: metallophosphoesterase [Bacteroidia bacterium]